MRNSYYDFNGWGRDSGVVPQKWEPGEVTPFEQEPQTSVPRETETVKSPKSARTKVGKPKRAEKSGAGGFLFFLALLLCLTGVGVYLQGGTMPTFPPEGGLWDILFGSEGWYRYYDYYEEYEEDNWRQELKNTTVARAPTGTGVTLP